MGGNVEALEAYDAWTTRGRIEGLRGTRDMLISWFTHRVAGPLGHER